MTNAPQLPSYFLSPLRHFCFSCGELGHILNIYSPPPSKLPKVLPKPLEPSGKSGLDRVTVHHPGKSEAKFLSSYTSPNIKSGCHQNMLGWTTSPVCGSFQNGRHRNMRNHVLGHNFSSRTARVTIFVSIPMLLGMENPMGPQKNVFVF